MVRSQPPRPASACPHPQPLSHERKGAHPSAGSSGRRILSARTSFLIHAKPCRAAWPSLEASIAAWPRPLRVSRPGRPDASNQRGGQHARPGKETESARHHRPGAGGWRAGRRHRGGRACRAGRRCATAAPCERITYVSGGIGSDEAAALRRIAPRFNVRMHFLDSGGDGSLSDVSVTLFNARREIVLLVLSEGPTCFSNWSRAPTARWSAMASPSSPTASRSSRAGARSTCSCAFPRGTNRPSCWPRRHRPARLASAAAAPCGRR